MSEHQIALALGAQPGSGEGSWHRVVDAAQAANGSDVLLLLTEWPQFADLDWAALAPLMRQPAWLFDARAVADAAAARAPGLRVWVVGDEEG